jgi:hypothetical protein
MSSEKAWYLAAVVVLGFGLVSRFEQRSWRASDAVDRVLNEATDRVEAVVATLSDQQEDAIVPPQVAVLRAERLACINSDIAREQVRAARIQAKMARRMAKYSFRSPSMDFTGVRVLQQP